MVHSNYILKNRSLPNIVGCTQEGGKSIAIELFDESSESEFLSTDEKNELRRAVLTNQYLIDYTHDIVSRIYVNSETKGDLNKLWRLIFSCKDHKSKDIAFRSLGGFDNVKKSIYEELLEDLAKENEDEDKLFYNIYNNELRYNIIKNCTPSDTGTLSLGINDPEFYISKHAESNYVPPEITGFKSHFKSYFPIVLQELFNIFIIIALVSQFREKTQLLLICAIIYSYITLNFKSGNSLIANARQNLTLFANLKAGISNKKEVEQDSALFSANNILKVETVKLYITGISTTIITIYLAYKFIAVVNLF